MIMWRLHAIDVQHQALGKKGLGPLRAITRENCSFTGTELTMVAQNIKQLQMSDDVNQTVGSPALGFLHSPSPPCPHLTSHFFIFFHPNSVSLISLSSFRHPTPFQSTPNPPVALCYTMSTNDKPTVLIVGAGLGGLMMGALFEKSGVPYTIFERAVAVKPLGMLTTCLTNRHANQAMYNVRY